jgi:protein SCO1/2
MRSDGKTRARRGLSRFQWATLGAAGGLLIVLAVMLMGWGENGSGGARAAIGGPFTLVTGDGNTVTDADFRGKWLLVYFGYTHCPDACPTALNDIAEALDQLSPERRKEVQTLFITVDPERDTPAVMKDYAAAFPGGNVVGLTGSKEQVVAAERSYRVYAKKHPTGEGEYEMDHSSIIYVMDPKGRFVANFTHETPPERIAEKLRSLLT